MNLWKNYFNNETLNRKEIDLKDNFVQLSK